MEDRTTEEVKKLKKEARQIVKYGWNPSHFMIDKSLAEKKAIQKGTLREQLYDIGYLPQFSVWPRAIIRVCQFHIIQAILRWVEERGRGESGKLSKKTGKRGKKGTSNNKLSLSGAGMKAMLEAFRWAQRCRNTSRDPWHQAQTIFEGNLRRICQADNLNAIITYFRDNWWCEEWRGSFIYFWQMVCLIIL